MRPSDGAAPNSCHPFRGAPVRAARPLVMTRAAGSGGREADAPSPRLTHLATPPGLQADIKAAWIRGVAAEILRAPNVIAALSGIVSTGIGGRAVRIRGGAVGGTDAIRPTIVDRTQRRAVRLRGATLHITALPRRAVAVDGCTGSRG